MTRAGRHRFGKELRLRRRRDFLSVQRRGRRGRGRLLTLVARRREDPSDLSRIGITASRKVGSAVARNRAKRLLREAFRLDRGHLAKGFDFVVIAAPAAARAGLAEVRRDLLGAASRLGRRR